MSMEGRETDARPAGLLSVRDWAVLTAIYVAAFLLTECLLQGDTWFYVRQVESVLRGAQSSTALLDFGHMLWRPLAAVLASFLPADNFEDRVFVVSAVMVGVSYIATYIGMLLFWWLVRSTGARWWPSLVVTAAMLCSYTVLNYGRSGSAYVPGFALMLAGCCAVIRHHQTSSRASWLTAVVCTATGVLLWTPFVLVTPAVALAAILVAGERPPWRRILVSGAGMLAVAGVIVMIVCAVEASMAGVRDVAGFLKWVRESAHGQFAGQRLIRMIFGLPRSFFMMGNDGILLKQFLFRDPYAGVSLGELFRASLLKPLLFYAACGASAWAVYRMRGRLPLLAWCLLGVIPTLALAIAVDAGSPERYMGLYPAVFIVFALALSAPSPLWARTLTALCIGVLFINNLVAQFRPWASSESRTVMERIASFGDSPVPKRVYVLERDPIQVIYYTNLFDKALYHLPAPLSVVPSLDSQLWKASFADRVLNSWQNGSEVWVTDRVWQKRPQRSWLWVEGDTGVLWKDVRQFFSTIVTDAQTSGPDNFRRIANTEANRLILTSNLKARK